MGTQAQVAVIIPSRGQIYSQTIDEVLQNVQSVDHKIYWSHANPLPLCFNLPIEEALKDPANTHFWIVEEDMQLPPGTLQELLDADVPCIANDYPLAGDNTNCVLYDPDGNAYFTGTGSILIKREVLELMPKPIFYANKQWTFKIMSDHIIFNLEAVQDPDSVYGQHDLNFGLDLYRMGMPIKVAKITCGHRRMVKIGEAGKNQGQHQIVTHTKTSLGNRAYHRFHNPAGMREVILDGKVVMIPEKRALEMIEQGIGKDRRTGHAVFNVS